MDYFTLSHEDRPFIAMECVGEESLMAEFKAGPGSPVEPGDRRRNYEKAAGSSQRRAILARRSNKIEVALYSEHNFST